MLKLLPLILFLLNGCAVGAGISGASAVSYYSIECGEASSLSKEAEMSLIYRIKKEISGEE